MKKIIYTFLIALLIISCGEQEVSQYDVFGGDVTLVQFETNNTLILVGTGTERTVEIPMSVSTYSDLERTITVEVNPNPTITQNLAQPENYSFNGIVTIPANELKGSLSFTGINVSGISEALQLQLIVAESSIARATLSPTIHTVNIAPEPVLWQGPAFIFVYDGGGNPSLPENQDRITDLVWFARGPNFPIYNASTETQFVFGDPFAASLSPVGTEWAVGSISDGVENLTFGTFAAILSSGRVHINRGNAPLVVHLIDEDIYFDLTWIDWHRGNGADGALGGFSYSRSTPNL